MKFKTNTSKLSEEVPKEFKGSSKPEVNVEEREIIENIDGEDRTHIGFIEVPTGKEIQMVWGEYCDSWIEPDNLDIVELTPKTDMSGQLKLCEDYFGKENII